MFFCNRNKKKDMVIDIDNTENKGIDTIEIVVGDDSDLEITDIGDFMNNLRPKINGRAKNKKIVIPKINKK